VSGEASRLSKALAGRYDIKRELGVGGMATVFLAHADFGNKFGH